MKLSTKRIVYNVAILCVLVGGLAYVITRFVHFGNVEYTDNAQVRQHITPVNTRVAGFVSRVCFDEFRPVRRGDTLALIEDSEYRLRLAQAEADLAGVLAGRDAAGSGVAATQNDLSVSDAAIEEARVQRDNARREWERYERLLAEEAVTRQQYDNVRTAYDMASARYDRLARAKGSATLARDGQAHRLTQSEAAVRLAEAAVDLARLNLSYTAIVATCDGVAGRKEIHEGQLVQPGQTIVDIVDGSEVWVVANYRETQMPHIAEGASVTVRADAVPGITFTGTVESISDATGNFVKVEQRVPVRIVLAGNDAADLARLRAGFNVECEVKY